MIDINVPRVLGHPLSVSTNKWGHIVVLFENGLVSKTSKKDEWKIYKFLCEVEE